jgi:hypothetical protein
MSEPLKITGTLDAIREDTDGEKINMYELAEALNSRGFGPLLTGPAIITILPTGAVPGVPDACALVIIFIAVQILMGRHNPWLPQRLKKISFRRRKFLSGIDKVKRYTRRVDKVVFPRLQFLTKAESQAWIALISVFLAVCISIMSFIPLLAALPAAGILFLGIGLSAKDGAFVIAGYLTAAISAVSLYYVISAIFG